jgi:protein-tyrosine-phosphatase
MRSRTVLPLFVCHANCCRSVLAKYLYEHLFPHNRALSAGIEVGEEINDRACAMLRYWSIAAAGHKPRRIDRGLCDEADAIFLMGPDYLRILLDRHGTDLASKAYLFADPFSVPQSFAHGEYLVYDPSFEERPISELAGQFSWFRERIVQIHEALCGRSQALVSATQYLKIL